MVNNIENNTSLNSVSDLENSKNKLEMMRYRTNGLSYMLGFIAIILSVFAAFISLNSMAVNTPKVIIKIFINIFVLLSGFLCCEKAKNYSKKGSIMLIVLGAVCVARIFWIPLSMMIDYTDMINNGGNNFSSYVLDNGLNVGKVMQGGAYAIRWLPQSGIFRGVTAIVLLVASGLAFIGSGVIGFIRSTKLADYLQSISKM